MMTIEEARKEWKQWNDKRYCLKAVEQNGNALQYVNSWKLIEMILTIQKLGGI